VKDLFGEYYPLTDAQVKECVVSGTIVLDANVLLGLYRFSSEERDTLFNFLTTAKERLWIPFQVGLEYQRTRLSVVAQQAGYYERLVELVEAAEAEALKKTMRGLRFPDEVRAEAEDLMERAASAAADAMEPFIAEATAIQSAHVVTRDEAVNADPVRDRLDDLFEGRVGARPSEKARNERILAATKRYAAEIPPGFKDAGKGTDELAAGDYLLWAELLEHAGSMTTEQSVLLVTQDEKEDWFSKDGQPLPALRREFGEHSVARFHLVSLKDFLSLANEHLRAGVSRSTIERAGNELLHEFTHRGHIAWPRADLSWTDNDELRVALLNALKTDPDLTAAYDPSVIARRLRLDFSDSDRIRDIVRDMLLSLPASASAQDVARALANGPISEPIVEVDESTSSHSNNESTHDDQSGDHSADDAETRD
jgi:hypothetical protein